MPDPRFVFDTNVMVSAALIADSVPARAYDLALRIGVLVASAQMIEELARVLTRPKLDAYLNAAERERFLQALADRVELVTPGRLVTASRDEDDNRILEAAIEGRVDAVVTGDSDLLDLKEFEGVTILTPASMLEQFAADP